MKKFIPFIFSVVLLISCQKEDDLTFEDNVMLEKIKNDSLNEENIQAKDYLKDKDTVIEPDPPVKEGEHWRQLK
ncbi:hypothetical protein [Flavobacterium sp. U410]|jgi:hypothetical protein